MKFCLLMLIILLNKCYSDASGHGPSLSTTDAVSKAAKYLLNRTDAANGQKNTVPRTVVALAFAARNGSLPDTTTSSLRKRLNNQIYVHLSQEHLKPSLFELAQYVNALIATCQDPRNFHGVNLVAQLREDLESAKKPTSNVLRAIEDFSPFPLLTLCIAGDKRREDYWMLNEIFNRTGNGNDRLSLKALIVMALACYTGNNVHRHSKVSEFVKDVRLEFNNSEIYTKSLSIQALYALKALYRPEEDEKLSLLRQEQLPDGSFGDLLSTYYAIPALLNKSLLDLKCESNNSKEHPSTLRQWNILADASGKGIFYSLWIDEGWISVTHSVKIGLHWNETFYDVMRRAEEEDEAFRFLYDQTRTGKKVYVLAGIPNDAESKKVWNLYQGSEGDVTLNSKQNLLKQTRGVDQIWPNDKDHFVFWFERDSN